MLARLQALELAIEVLQREADKTREEIKRSFTSPQPTATQQPLPALVPEPESRVGKRGPDKQKRRISPEVRAKRIATLAAARAALARKRAEERRKSKREGGGTPPKREEFLSVSAVA